MSRASKITNYNPAISVEENAKKNGVSVAAIRNYIKVHDLDRRHERKQNIIAACKKYLKKHPKATRNELHENTGYSLTTIRQYWEYITTEKELIDFNKNKIQKRSLRQDNNFYATHPSVTLDILREERFSSEILEPFCGSGTMAEVIRKSGYDVAAFDIVDRGYGKQADFFSTEFPVGEYDIITNPPYDDGLIEIVHRCLDICKNKVALLLPVQYLSGQERFDKIYSVIPPTRVYIYLQRINIAKNADFKKYEDRGANKTIYAWYIWEKKHIGGTELRWIQNRMR